MLDPPRSSSSRSLAIENLPLSFSNSLDQSWIPEIEPFKRFVPRFDTVARRAVGNTEDFEFEVFVDKSAVELFHRVVEPGYGSSFLVYSSIPQTQIVAHPEFFSIEEPESARGVDEQVLSVPSEVRHFEPFFEHSR